MRGLSRMLIATATSLLIAPAGVWAAKQTCLTGTDPAVANDTAKISAVRALIDAGCDCTSFDGSAASKKHADYVKCAKNVIKAQADAGSLRKPCKGTVTKWYSDSSCGLDPNLHSAPCVELTLSNGKVKCKVKATTNKDGTTLDPKCASKPGKSDALVCVDHTHCIDAADVNDDLVIGSGPGGDDTGACACMVGLGDCNGQSNDGCETDVKSSVNNCGGCAHVCNAPTGGTAACGAGACGGLCPAGRNFCGGSMNGGGACALEACPQLTQQSGDGTAGVDYLDICPSQQGLQGFDVNVQSGYITQIWSICGGMDTTAGRIVPTVTIGPRGSADPSQPNSIQSVRCPLGPGGAGFTQIPNTLSFTGTSGYALVGFEALTDSSGSRIAQLTIRCAPISGTVTVTGQVPNTNLLIIRATGGLGSPFALSPVGGTVGSPFPVADCSPGFGATAAHIGANGGVSAFGLGCAAAPLEVTFQSPVTVSCG